VSYQGWEHLKQWNDEVMKGNPVLIANEHQ
jgi:hypothetical protein